MVPLELPPFTMWTSEHRERPKATIDNLRDHHRVVWSSITRDVTPLPVRFGQWFRTREALASSIRERSAEYEECLARFRGKLEFGLRVIDPAGVPAVLRSGNGEETAGPRDPRQAEPSGTEYLRALARRQTEREEARRRAAELAAEVERHLEGLIARQRSDPLIDHGGVVALAHLVDRGRVPQYRRAREALRRRYGPFQLIATGPWPPYSFVR